MSNEITTALRMAQSGEYTPTPFSYYGTGTPALAGPSTWQQASEEVAVDIVKLLARKQHDYGQGNILRFGENGVLVRMSDKFERLYNLVLGDKPTQVAEAVDDTISDIVGYGIIWLMLRRGTFTLPLDKTQFLN